MKYKVLSLFSGLAGLDLGFSERVIVHRDSADEEFVESEAPTKDFVHLKQLPFTTVFLLTLLGLYTKVCKRSDEVTFPHTTYIWGVFTII